MTLKFLPLSHISSLERQSVYRNILAACPQIASDYSFVNIWGWAEAYGLEWAWENDLVWIRQTLPEILYWAPVGPWNTINWQARLTTHFQHSARFIRVPDVLLSLWYQTVEFHLEVEELRGHWDYVYAVSDLVDLKGNRYHKKKNLLNQFLKKYDFTFSAFDPALVTQALSMQTDWCEWRDCESSETLSSENRAIERILTNWDSLEGVIGGAIIIDQRLVAYTVAEPLTKDMVVIHFEKGNPEITGSYQAINQMFLQSRSGQFQKVNREQDIDDPGLRQSKLSYHPAEFIKKFSVYFS